MFSKIFCAILGIFLLTGSAYAQEGSVTLRQTPQIVNSYCGISTSLAEAQKDDPKVFVGAIDESNILYVTLDENGFWTVVIDNLSGVACVYFMGRVGTPMIDMDEKKKKDKDLKGNIGRRVNGEHIYK